VLTPAPQPVAQPVAPPPVQAPLEPAPAPRILGQDPGPPGRQTSYRDWSTLCPAYSRIGMFVTPLALLACLLWAAVRPHDARYWLARSSPASSPRRLPGSGLSVSVRWRSTASQPSAPWIGSKIPIAQQRPPPFVYTTNMT